MATRLMTPFCFASVLAAALLADAALPAGKPVAPAGWSVPMEAVGGLEWAEDEALEQLAFTAM